MSAELRPRVALVAHDACKDAMTEWAGFNRGSLGRCELYATATTGRLVATELGLDVVLLLSGPHGGDAQIGAMIAERRLDAIVFFWDPLTTQPHDVRREGVAAVGGALRRPDRLQPQFGGFPDLVTLVLRPHAPQRPPIRRSGGGRLSGGGAPADFAKGRPGRRPSSSTTHRAKRRSGEGGR